MGEKRVVLNNVNDKDDRFYVSLLVWAVVFGIFLMVAVQGFDVITVTPTSSSVVNETNISGPVLEDISFTMNITINNTAALAFDNITQVNVTLPASFTFLDNNNYTNASGVVSFNFSAGVLSWNSSLVAGTNAVLVANATKVNFWFTFNASTPGHYNITITTMNVSGFVNGTNLSISVTVNDTTIPSNITFQGATPLNGSFIAGNETNNASIFINLSAYDNGAIQSFLTRLSVNINSTNVTLNQTNLTTISNISQEVKLNRNFTLNFTNLADGIYFLNVTVNDTYNNVNGTFAVSQTRTFVVDNLFPNVSYGVTSDANGTFVARNWTIINLTIVEVNPNATNISIHNSSGWVFQSNVTQSNGSIIFNITNLSGLADGVYFVNVTANDSAGHRNLSLSTRTFIIDTTVPVPSYGSQTDGNNSFVPRSFILVNISVVEANFNFTNITLSNSSGHFNQTIINRSVISQLANFSGLVDGVYFVNVTTNDSAGWSNETLFHRTFTVDTLVAVPSYGTGTESTNAYVNRNFVIVNVSVIDRNVNSTNISLHNSSGGVVRGNLSYNVSDFGGNGTMLNLYVNFTGLDQGVYYFNVSANDSAGNRNISLPTRNITIDTSAPVVTLGESDSSSTLINASITISESVTSINGSCTSNRAGATITGTGGSQRLQESGLQCSTTYSYTITCLDMAGNPGSVIKSFSTSGCDGGSSGGSSGGAGTNAVQNTIIVNNADFEKGYVTSVKKNEQLRVEVPVYSSSGVSTGSTEAHTVKVTNIDLVGKKANIEVASTPQKVVMSVGETKKFDVSNDSYYDLQVKLESVSALKVNVTIKSIHELMPGKIAPVVSVNDTNQNNVVNLDDNSADLNDEEEVKSNSWILWIIVAVIVVVIIIVAMKIYKNK